MLRQIEMICCIPGRQAFGQIVDLASEGLDQAFWREADVAVIPGFLHGKSHLIDAVGDGLFH